MATYCVVFRAPQAHHAVRFFLQANSADRAFATAMEENPDLRPLGVELAGIVLSTSSGRKAA